MSSHRDYTIWLYIPAFRQICHDLKVLKNYSIFFHHITFNTIFQAFISFYPIILYRSNMGRIIAATMNPTTPPNRTIINGSIMVVIWLMAVSTSSS